MATGFGSGRVDFFKDGILIPEQPAVRRIKNKILSIKQKPVHTGTGSQISFQRK